MRDEGNPLAGIGVHLAVRIQAAAAPYEILVSSTVRDLMTGSEVAFEDSGGHELSGVDGPRTPLAGATFARRRLPRTAPKS